MIKHHSIDLVNAEQYKHERVEYTEIGAKRINVFKYNDLYKPKR